MKYTSPLLQWVTIPDWQEGSLAILAQPGLFRFRQDRRIVFIGYATSAKPGLNGRIGAYRRGADKNHQATQLIFQNKQKLELQVALTDIPPTRIRAIAKELIARDKPAFNEKNAYAGRI